MDDLDDRDDLTDKQKEDYRRQRKLNAEREAKMCPSVVMIMKPVEVKIALTNNLSGTGL